MRRLLYPALLSLLALGAGCTTDPASPTETDTAVAVDALVDSTGGPDTGVPVDTLVPTDSVAPIDTLVADTRPPTDTTQPPLETLPLAPSYTEAMVSGMQVLGPKVVDGGVSFTLYSEHATRIELVLFDNPDVATPRARVVMTRFGDVWSAFVRGVGVGQHYGYACWGPNWPYDPAWTLGSDKGFIADVDAAGNRYNPNKLLIDPYAKALNRDFDPKLPGPGTAILATGHGRKSATWAGQAKSVVVESTYTWSAHEATWRARRADPNAAGNGWNEHIAYEVHVKGFTMIPSSGAAHGGTFRGVAEKADYLVDLGITAVELMPINEKPLPNDGGYWGYQPLNYFVPENKYAFKEGDAAKTPVGVVDEFKAMVDALHQKGLEVWIDVVYNHTGEGGNWTERPAGFLAEDTVSLYTLRGIDNAAYYALTADGKGYWPNTGVGNMLRTNHKPGRQLILDSLRYLAEELHVDGFRFDLAPVLGAKDGDYDRWDSSGQSVVDLIINDPVLQGLNTRIIAEPWATGGDYNFKLGGFPAATSKPGVGWYEWNAHFRDWWRGFMNDDARKLNSKEGPADLGYTMTGSHDTFAHNGRRPYHAMNFVTVHDGMTMYDLFSCNAKQNACSPVNTICCSEPESVWCQPNAGEDNNRSRDWGAANEAHKRQLMRNLYVALLVSHGTPLLYGGDEWMRSQFCNNNAWTDSADNSASWFQWGAWKNEPERVRMHDFVRKLVAFRRANLKYFAPTQYSGTPWLWRNAANTGGPDWSSRHLAIIHTDPATTAPKIAVLINMEAWEVSFTLPGGSWARVVDTQKWFDDAPYFTQSGAPSDTSSNIDPGKSVVVTGSYGVVPSSFVILEAVGN